MRIAALAGLLCFAGFSHAAAAPPAETPVNAPAQSQPPASERPAEQPTGGTPASASPAKTEAAAAAAAPQPPAKPKPVAPTLVARVDLPSQSMTVSINGKVVHRWKISSGVKGYETPTGSFKPSWKAEMWRSRTYDNAPMPHSVFFKDGAAVHGSNSVSLLGRPASHGCVRLGPANARTFYKLVGRHGFDRTRIVVAGKAPAVGFPGSRSSADRYAYTAPDQVYRRRAPREQQPVWYYPVENRRYVYPGDTTASRYRPYWSR